MRAGGQPARAGAGGGARPARGGGARGPGQRGGGDRPRGKGAARKGGGRKAGRYEGKGFSIFDRGRRDDRRQAGPRKISLKPDDPKQPPEAEVIDESKLTPEELMQKKLDEMRRKLQGDE